MSHHLCAHILLYWFLSSMNDLSILIFWYNRYNRNYHDDLFRNWNEFLEICLTILKTGFIFLKSYRDLNNIRQGFWSLGFMRFVSISCLCHLIYYMIAFCYVTFFSGWVTFWPNVRGRQSEWREEWYKQIWRWWI